MKNLEIEANVASLGADLDASIAAMITAEKKYLSGCCKWEIVKELRNKKEAIHSAYDALVSAWQDMEDERPCHAEVDSQLSFLV